MNAAETDYTESNIQNRCTVAGRFADEPAQPGSTPYTSETTDTEPNAAHALPLTAERIEREITQAHANVLAVVYNTSALTKQNAQDTIDRAAHRELRAIFTLGQDNGRALVLAQADQLLAKPVADSQAEQLGRAMLLILEWASKKEGRGFAGAQASFASVVAADEADKFEGYWHHYEYGSSAAESIAKLGTWCSEQLAQANSAAAVQTVERADDEALF